MITLPRTQVLAAVLIAGTAVLVASGLVDIPSNDAPVKSAPSGQYSWTPNSLSTHRDPSYLLQTTSSHAAAGAAAVNATAASPVTGAHSLTSPSAAGSFLSGSHTQPIIVTAALLAAAAPSTGSYLPASHATPTQVAHALRRPAHSALRGPVEVYLPDSHSQG